MNDAILERSSRDPLFGWQRESLENELRQRLMGRVESAFFFGSYTTPAFGADSDIDLFLVQQTDVPFVDRPAMFADLLDVIPTMDLLVYTPAEFQHLITEPTSGFWTQAVQTMRRLL